MEGLKVHMFPFGLTILLHILHIFFQDGYTCKRSNKQSQLSKELVSKSVYKEWRVGK